MEGFLRRFQLRITAATVLTTVLMLWACGNSPSEAEMKKNPPPIPDNETENFVCTQVIGFSQTRQWYADAPDFESVVDDDRWQLLWQGGAGIDRWSDPEFEGWSQQLVSPCSNNSASPDRIILTISGKRQSNPAIWAEQIRAAIDVIRSKYPSVRQIVLQPVVGGPNNGECPIPGGGVVRATANHPIIDEAIALVVGGDVIAGASPEVSSCDDFRDSIGHLTDSATGTVGRSLGEFYTTQR